MPKGTRVVGRHDGGAHVRIRNLDGGRQADAGQFLRPAASTLKTPPGADGGETNVLSSEVAGSVRPQPLAARSTVSVTQHGNLLYSTSISFGSFALTMGAISFYRELIGPKTQRRLRNISGTLRDLFDAAEIVRQQ